MKKISKLLFLALTLIAFGCSSDSESDLMQVDDPQDPQGGPVTYNADVRAVINSRCLACHSEPPRNGAPFPLTNFEQVELRANNGSLLRAISRQTGESGAMPPSGRLPQSTIDLIAQWIEDGTLEE